MSLFVFFHSTQDVYKRQINESAVLTLVSDTLRAFAEYSRNDRTEFIHTVQETQVAQQSADISKKRRHLATAQKLSLIHIFSDQKEAVTRHLRK